MATLGRYMLSVGMICAAVDGASAEISLFAPEYFAKVQAENLYPSYFADLEARCAASEGKMACDERRAASVGSVAVDASAVKCSDKGKGTKLCSFPLSRINKANKVEARYRCQAYLLGLRLATPKPLWALRDTATYVKGHHLSGVPVNEAWMTKGSANIVCVR